MTALERLALFNEKADRLREGRLVRMLESEGFGIQADFTQEKTKILRSGADADSVMAAILTLRFFLQDNEPCSMRNLSRLYEETRIPVALRGEFSDLRKSLNEYLDGTGNLVLEKPGTSRRENFNAALYGDLSHSSPSHKKLYKKLRASAMRTVISESEFMHTFAVILRMVFEVSDLNVRVIESNCLD